MAALRAMGCTRRRVTGMFSCQQGLLCLLGILLGLVALGALRGGMEGVWKGKTLLCAGLYFLGANPHIWHSGTQCLGQLRQGLTVLQIPSPGCNFNAGDHNFPVACGRQRPGLGDGGVQRL